MSVRTAPAPFELETTGDTGLYDTFLDNTISGYGSGTTTANSAGIKWRLTADTSEMHNLYTGSGTADLREITRRDSSDYGLKPGDSGTLTFAIVPNSSDDINVKLNLSFTGYAATFALQDDVYYKTNDPLTVVTDTTVNHFLSSHIFFFYKDSNNKKHIITSDGFTVSVSGRTEVTLYWVWPATLQEILNANIDNLNDTDASKEVKRLFFEHPDYFLKKTGTESFSDITVLHNDDAVIEDAAIDAVIGNVSGRNYTEYGSKYNDADQSIGDHVNYILVELVADLDNSG